MSHKDSQTDGEAARPLQRDDAAKTKWRLTKEAFDTLLTNFSSDREEAGRQYQTTHRKLVRFFEWRGIKLPEDRADETMNRVARRLDEGQVVNSLLSYVYGVARIVYLEALKEQNRASSSLEEVMPNVCATLDVTSETDPRLLCFDSCIEGLAVESRFLILGYYQGEQRAKIQLRQQLASNLRIPLNALRIRVHRIRVSLEECIRKCLGAKSV